MFNNDKKFVSVITFDNTLDEYGQARQGSTTSRYVEMMICDYKQNMLTDDIRFKDVEKLGLVKNAEFINDTNQVIADGITYNVLGVIPSRRLQQVLLKKV